MAWFQYSIGAISFYLLLSIPRRDIVVCFKIKSDNFLFFEIISFSSQRKTPPWWIYFTTLGVSFLLCFVSWIQCNNKFYLNIFLFISILFSISSFEICGWLINFSILKSSTFPIVIVSNFPSFSSETYKFPSWSIEK